MTVPAKVLAPLLTGAAAVAVFIAKGATGFKLAGVPTHGQGASVRRRQRANGVNAKLQAFLDQWVKDGPFEIGVGDDGGVRTDAAKQLAYFKAGNSNASTLDQTAHGRGGALDLYPVIGGHWRGLQGDPNPADSARYFAVIGARAKAAGLAWGGDFKTMRPDLPHIEVPSWRTLPMPGAGVKVS